MLHLLAIYSNIGLQLDYKNLKKTVINTLSLITTLNYLHLAVTTESTIESFPPPCRFYFLRQQKVLNVGSMFSSFPGVTIPLAKRLILSLRWGIRNAMKNLLKSSQVASDTSKPSHNTETSFGLILTDELEGCQLVVPMLPYQQLLVVHQQLSLEPPPLKLWNVDHQMYLTFFREVQLVGNLPVLQYDFVMP